SSFFFQAEDGIRDYKVTGVQTCALPISKTSLGMTFDTLPPRTTVGVAVLCRSGVSIASLDPTTRRTCLVSAGTRSPRSARRSWRSEERRVGKEGRSGWREAR